MGMLEGKRALIFGVANDKSIAWGVAKAFKEQGASVALSYVNEAIKKRVEPLAEELGADFVFEMDVTNDEHYKNLAATVSNYWEHFDIIVHSLAFANREDLKGNFVDTSREGFKLACDISAFSLVGISHELVHMMKPGGSIMAMTFYGSQKVVSNYNVMGVAKAALEASTRYLANDLGEKDIRVNCISPGPVKTLAASGITGFRSLLAKVEENVPMKRNITSTDVGGTACFLASPLSSGITGQVIYVDSGLSIMGGF